MDLHKLWKVGFSIFALSAILPLMAEEVGSLNGQLFVSPSGSANYQIPIELPPSLSGIEPSISLVYDSNSRHISSPMKLSDIQPGSGSMGIGWSIAGLSSISRCPTDLTRDGFIDAVDYDDNDQFCLDGQRLILVSGSHGRNGAEYRTEINGFDKIIAQGSAGNGPVSFQLWRQNGEVVEYGVSPESRQKAHGQIEIDRWNISRARNANGNWIGFSYEENYSEPYYRLKRIKYDSVTLNFEYSNMSTEKEVLLKSVVVNNKAAEVYRYLIQYENGGDGGSYRISTIQKCAAIYSCVRPVRFEWKNGGKGITYAGQGSGGTHAYWNTVLDDGKYKGRTFQGDFNGDGKTDVAMIYRDPNSSAVSIYHWNADASGKLTYAGQGSGGTHAYWNTVLDNGTYNGRTFQGDFNGDGKTDVAMIYRDPNSSVVSIYNWNTDNLPYLVIDSITDSFGIETKVNYESGISPNVYTQLGEVVYPLTNAQNTNFIVSSVQQDNGSGGKYSVYYRYEGMRTHLRGLGSLGFSKITTSNDKTGVRNITEYAQEYDKRLVGQPVVRYTVLYNGVVKSRTDTNYDSRMINNSNRYFQSVRSSVQKEKSLSGEDVSRTTIINCEYDYVGCTSMSHDEYGNAKYSKKEVADIQNGLTFFEEARSEYWPLNSFYTGNDRWFPSQLKQTKVTKWDSNNSAKTVTAEFNSYYPDGKLKRETVEPGASQLVTEYDYEDSFGRLTKTTVSGSDVVTRSGAITYDSGNPYLMTERNALGHTTVSELDPVFGKALFKQDENGIRTHYAYDGFGRVQEISYANGTKDTFSYEWCSTSVCPTGGKYYIEKSTTDSGVITTSRVIYDKLLREVSSASQGFGGEIIYTDTHYDSKGRKYKKSEPYFAGEMVYFTENIEYDILGRATKVRYPDGSISTVAYNGFRTEHTNSNNQTKTVLLNAVGNIIQSTDDNYNDVRFGYDALGNQNSVIDSSGNEIRTVYDIRGNRLSISDPDKGLWRSMYNVRGQLITQTDAKGQTTCMAYDALDRMIKRIDLYTGSSAQAKADCTGNDANPTLTTWHYDTAIKGVGKLHQVRGSNGYFESLTYDHLGRSIGINETISGVTYTTGRVFYPNSGRVKEQVYPSAGGRNFKITSLYNAYGYLYQTKNSESQTPYWTVNAMDAQGHVTQFTLGNSVVTTNEYRPDSGYISVIDSQKSGVSFQHLTYQFDTSGNLKYRKDWILGTTEDLAYDNLNRLVSSTVSGNTNSYSSFTYDALGNIRSKTGVGAYSYGIAPDDCTVKHAGPHAVTKVSGGSMHSAAEYCYDENGSLTSGGGRTLSYTAFDKPAVIHRGNKSVSLLYGPDRKRVQKSDHTGLTTYVNGIYEKNVSGNVVKHKYYVGKYAVVTVEDTSTRTHYLHRDHLGSVDAITDEYGVVKERQSFDAWGKRRHQDWESPLDLYSFSSNVTNRGFTNHEQLDSVGLIHMNGRAYDPILGRFVSADPFVQEASNSQALNRYSYVQNNPLSNTDPTGYFLKKLESNVDRGLKNFDNYMTTRLDNFAANNNEVTNLIASTVLMAYGGPVGQWYGYRHGTLSSRTFRIGSGAVAGFADTMGCSGACSSANAFLQSKIMGGTYEQAFISAGFAYLSYATFSNSEISSWGQVGARAVTGGAYAVAQSRLMGGDQANDGKIFRIAFTARLIGDSMQYYIESHNSHLEGGAEPTLAPGIGVDKTKGSKSVAITGINKSNAGITANFNAAGKLIDECGNIVESGEWMYETSLFMQTVSKVPGMNYMAGFHDTWMHATGASGSWVQWSIPVAMVPTYTMFNQQERQRDYMESLVRD